MTVDDVLYSFDTCAATSVETSLVEALSIDSIKATDDSTVVIKLKSASAEFISYLAYVYITQKDYADNKTQPISTGPFKFQSRSVQENVILERMRTTTVRQPIWTRSPTRFMKMQPP